MTAQAKVKPPLYTRSTLPDARGLPGELVIVQEPSGAFSTVFSNGLSWIVWSSNDPAANQIAVTAAATLTTQTLVKADATSAGFTVTLPPAALNFGPVTVVKTDASVNVVTVAPAAGTINGAANKALTASQYAALTFYSDGTNWFAK